MHRTVAALQQQVVRRSFPLQFFPRPLREVAWKGTCWDIAVLEWGESSRIPANVASMHLTSVPPAYDHNNEPLLTVSHEGQEGCLTRWSANVSISSP